MARIIFVPNADRTGGTLMFGDVAASVRRQNVVIKSLDQARGELFEHLSLYRITGEEYFEMVSLIQELLPSFREPEINPYALSKKHVG